MQASVPMSWGLICSIEDEQQIIRFIEFGSWMCRHLEESAAKLQLGHRFEDRATFALHAMPGSVEDVRAAYIAITENYPQVSYVIHILPSKDSIEYKVLKEATLEGALVGQGILAENALSHFKCYDLNDVMANMNQWIGRRLSQITARRTEEALAKQIQEMIKVPPPQIQAYQQAIETKQTPRMSQNKNHRKDNYRLTVSSGSGSSRFRTGGNATPLMDQQITLGKPALNIWNNSNNRQQTNDFDFPVNVVLHSQIDRGYNFGGAGSTQHYPYRPPSAGSNNERQSQKVHPKQQPQNFDGKEREKEVIVRGYPQHFNKFQIASLFSNFRPLNVQYIGYGEAIVQFANKFHATQIIANYNGYKFEDEGFTLQVRTAAQEEPAKQIAAMKTKMAGLMLKMVTTGKAGGLETRAKQQQRKVLTISSADSGTVAANA